MLTHAFYTPTLCPIQCYSMKNTLFIVLIILSSLSFGQELYPEVETLIADQKYSTAFNKLDSIDPENKDPNVVLLKTDLALNFFVQSIMHQVFAFKDLEEGEDLYELRSGLEGTYDVRSFPINEILDSLLLVYPKDYRLNRVLSDYYYRVQTIYGSNWVMPEEEVLSAMVENAIVAIDNGEADYMSFYSVGYYNTLYGEYGKAIPFFKNSIIANPDYPTSHYNLSICFIYLEMPDSAIISAVRASELYDDQIQKSDAARVASIAFLESGNIKDALKYAKLSYSIIPDDYYNLKHLLTVELQDGKETSSEKTAIEFFSLDPTNPQICTDLVDIFLGADKGSVLLEFFDKRVTEYNENYEVLGNIYFHKGQLARAMEENRLAKNSFLKAKENFEKVFPSDHYVFEVLNEAINE